MTNPGTTGPQDAPLGPQEPTFLNPFEGSAQVNQRPRELDLGAGALGGVELLIPPHIPQNTETYPQDAEVLSDASIAAKKVCGKLAEAYVQETDPSKLVFPKCSDLTVINEVLKEIVNTPLGLGYGNFPANIMVTLNRFVQEVAAAYREDRKLGPADLVPLDIELPEWLESNPLFDTLAGVTLADITVRGEVKSVLATNAKHCRIRFTDEVRDPAKVGAGARRCTFIFDRAVTSERSFNTAQNCTVQFNGGHPRGIIGTMTDSRVECTGVWDGLFLHNGTSTHSRQVMAEFRSR